MPRAVAIWVLKCETSWKIELQNCCPLEAEITVAEDCGNHDKGDDVLKASVVAEEAVVAVGHHAHEGGAVYASVLQQGGKHRGKAVVRGSRARVRKSEDRSLILSHIEINFTLRSTIAP